MSAVARVHVRGVGFAIEGLPNWSATRAVLKGEAPYAHAPFAHASPEILPAAERRRAGAVIRLSIAVAHEAAQGSGVAVAELASVFASSDSDGENIHHICAALAGDKPEISPTRFHNSVQNAASGYWSIATRSHAASSTVNGFDMIFSAGLLEAAVLARTEERPVLLVSYDVPMVEPLLALRPLSTSCGSALVLDSKPSPQTLATLDIAVVARETVQPTVLAHAELERLRVSNPAARALALLDVLARGVSGEVVLELDTHLCLSVKVAAPA